MCCGYRVLLLSPSLLAIDFTVFVRFIPFYFHQGKLGCQDLLTRNKPLSPLMIITFHGWLQKAPRLCVTGMRLLAFTHPSQPPCLSLSGCTCIQLTSLQRTKPETDTQTQYGFLRLLFTEFISGHFMRKKKNIK